MNRTKIVCTLGPASQSPEMLGRLVDAGMCVARINASHGDQDQYRQMIADVRRVAAERGRPVGVLMDLGGAKIRIGPIAEKTVTLQPDEPFRLTKCDVPGDETEVSLGYKRLPEEVHEGDRLLLSDGAIELHVDSTDGETIRTTVVTGGLLTSHKGINLPGRSLGVPTLTEKDKRDLAFALEHDVDFVSLSFVRKAGDVEEARALVEQAGKSTPLVAKIEQHEALEHIDEILAVVDGIMIARGDLGVEVPIEHVARIQKDLIRKCRTRGIPVITATQMLLSMVDQPRPTRAEATDVANAVLDGTDAVMLSEETAIGVDPARTVRMMARIAASAEEVYPFGHCPEFFAEDPTERRYVAIAQSVVQVAQDIGAKAIVGFTLSGSTAVRLSRERPRQPILAPTPDPATCRRLSLVWGVVAVEGEATEDVEELERQASRLALEAGVAEEGDTVVITAGVPLNTQGATNLFKIATVSGRSGRR